MISETDVITAVCKKLESMGYTIRQKFKTKVRGIDIIAVKKSALSVALYIEAKGESSATNVQIDVADALYKAIAVLAIKAERDQVMVGIAFPDTKEHRKYIHVIEPVLNQLNITIFWVRPRGVVEVASSWGV